METARSFPGSSSDPPVVERKAPTFLSPRWFWAVVCAVCKIFTPSFWKGLKDPDKQAVWQVSSAVTAFQIFGVASAYKFAEVHAPWLIKGVVLLGSSLKAIGTTVATFLIAAWNVFNPF